LPALQTRNRGRGIFEDKMKYGRQSFSCFPPHLISPNRAAPPSEVQDTIEQHDADLQLASLGDHQELLEAYNKLLKIRERSENMVQHTATLCDRLTDMSDLLGEVLEEMLPSTEGFATNVGGREQKDGASTTCGLLHSASSGCTGTSSSSTTPKFKSASKRIPIPVLAEKSVADAHAAEFPGLNVSPRTSASAEACDDGR
jgi:hypothetical protein